MDLTTGFPRSVKETFAGVVMLARTTDKAKATLAGTQGEYHYNCPMDQGVFGFLGIDHEQYLATVKNAKNDGEIEAYARSYSSKKSPDEIAAFNAEFLGMSPAPGGDSEAYFHETLKRVAPDRTDVTTWADLLDLEEGREVPRKATA